MTKEEMDKLKEELKAELKKEVMEEINASQSTPPPPFKLVREKWISCRTQKTIFDKMFDPHKSYKIWSSVRPITSIICSSNDVRRIQDTEFAEYAAEELCQKIHDLRLEFLKKQTERKE